MTYESAKAEIASIEARLSRATAVMDAFPRGVMNLTPDSVKATPEWKDAKAEVDAAFRALRAANSGFVKRFAKEIRLERRKPR